MSADYILAIDYGTKNVGLALASVIAKIPAPYDTYENNDSLVDRIKELIDKESVNVVVVGLPRNLQGNDTEQTNITRDFVKKLANIEAKIVLQDEAATSYLAEKELSDIKHKKNSNITVDSLAACYILRDYINEEYGYAN